MNPYRTALNTWWKLLQALADPSLDSEVRAGNATPGDTALASSVPSTTSLALSQLGLLEDARETFIPQTD